MATPTYDLIEEKVLGSAQATVTFSSIPGTYKDLVLEIIFGQGTADDVGIRFNADTNTNYSSTYLVGNGTTASSGRYSTQTYILPRIAANPPTTVTATWTEQIMSYANTNVNKTTLGRVGYAAGETEAHVGLWRSTAAITSVLVACLAQTFSSGSTFRLWGIA